MSSTAYKSITVTPEMAQAFLSNQIPNRTIKPSLVRKYARLMRSGRWRARPVVALAFTGAMQLVDGQHRMLAVIEFGRPVEFFYVDDATQEDRSMIGEIARHSIGDELVCSGRSGDGVSAVLAGATYGWIFRAEAGDVFNTGEAASATELVDVAGRHPKALESIRWAMRETPRHCRLAPVAFMRYVGTSLNQAIGTAFFDRLRDGTGMRDGDPALALTRALCDQSSRKKTPSRVAGAFIALAWRAETEGRELRKICFRPERDGWPEIVGLEAILHPQPE